MNAFVKNIPQYTKAHMFLFNALVKAGIPCLTEEPIEIDGELTKDGNQKGYWPDILIPHKKIIIEVEGDFSSSKNNPKRDRYLESKGYVVMHFSNKEVLHDPQEVVSRIRERMRGF